MKVRKLNWRTLLVLGWALTFLFLWLAFNVKNETLANAMSDAFGTALSLVLITTVTIIYLVVKKVLK